jgi:hypothetical protein
MKPAKPKIVSKDNSSPSAKEQIKLTKYGKVELTPLAEKLMVFAKEDKSVLLYGDYAGDLSVFISGFHDVLHGLEPIFEYVGKKKMPMSFSPSEYLTKKMAKVISDRDHERIYELLRDFERTDNTYLEVDCNPDDGKTVFEKLTCVNHFTQEEFIDEMPPVMKKPRKHEMYPYWESFCTDIMANKDNFSKAFSNATSYRSQPLLERKGTLFVNNLTCNGSEDKKWFKALGKEIKKCKYSEGEWYISQTKKDGWLVVAIDDLDDFPQIFVDQFELVPLDAETIEGDEPALRIDSNLCTLGFKSEVKLEPIVFALFELLFENKDSFVTTKDIHNSLWPEKQNAGSVYDQQIYQHIGILRTALKGIGIEGEIITTTSKSKFKEGGYIFHGNMIH